MDYIGGMRGEVTENARIVTLKVTHKFFHDVYEEVT